MYSVKNLRNFFLAYICLLIFINSYYLISLNTSLTNNAMSEWLINYQGGFVRRGLLGELVFQISLLSNVDIKFSFLLIQILLYFVYYLSIYFLLRDAKLSYFVILAIFSPVFLLFPVSELEALGRKEILVSFLLISLIIINNFQKNLQITFFIFGSLSILLIHEIIVLHIFYFILYLLISNKNNNFSFNIKIFFSLIIFLIFTIFLYLNEYTEEMKNLMCQSLINNFDVICGFQTHYVANSITTYVSEVSWKLEHLIRNIIIFILGFGPLLIVSFFSKFNKNISNKLINRFSPFVILNFLIIPNMLIFFISVDTGRYFHLSYSNLFIFFFGLYYKKIILIDYKKLENFELKIFPKKKILCYLFVFIFCFSWAPKAIYLQDIGSIPLYRTIEKMPNYYKGITDLKIRRKKGL